MQVQPYFEPVACSARCQEQGGQYQWDNLDEATLQSTFESLAQSIMAQPNGQALCYLMGPLGAGKSTAARAFIRKMGVQGPIKSPTYALLEPYELSGSNGAPRKIGHWDLYRLTDPEEIEQLGFRETVSEPGVQLVEWPEQGAGYLPWPDVAFHLQLPAPSMGGSKGSGEDQPPSTISDLPVIQTRRVLAYAFSEAGVAWLAAMNASLAA